MNALHTDTPTWTAAFLAMVAESGRKVDGAWLWTNSYATMNCIGEHHDWCHGWVAPRVYAARECICPCHDEVRPSYNEARALTP